MSDSRAWRKRVCPSTTPNPVGFPGFTATPWKSSRPFAAMASRIRSRSPTELPPEKTTMSHAIRSSSVEDERVERVGRREIGDRNTAVFGDDRRKA